MVHVRGSGSWSAEGQKGPGPGDKHPRWHRLPNVRGTVKVQTSIDSSLWLHCCWKGPARKKASLFSLGTGKVPLSAFSRGPPAPPSASRALHAHFTVSRSALVSESHSGRSWVSPQAEPHILSLPIEPGPRVPPLPVLVGEFPSEALPATSSHLRQFRFIRDAFMKFKGPGPGCALLLFWEAP